MTKGRTRADPAGQPATKVGEGFLDHPYDTLRSLIESSASPIFTLDAEYRYTSFNASHATAMKALYGADIALGKSLLEYQSAVDGALAKANLDRALAGESILEEACSGDAERLRRYFEVAHDPIRDADGAVVGVAVQARDVTERRAMEAAGRESEARLRVAREAGLGVFEADLASGVHQWDTRTREIWASAPTSPSPTKPSSPACTPTIASSCAPRWRAASSRRLSRPSRTSIA